MLNASQNDVSEKIYSVSLQIKQHFTAPDKLNQTNKWFLLEDFYTNHIVNCTLSAPVLSSYNNVTTTLLDCLKPTLFTDPAQEEIFDILFLEGIHHESFMILVRALDGSRESFQQDKILDILEKYLRGSSITSLLLCHCINSGILDQEYIAVSQTAPELLALLVSLPERVANKMKGRVHKIFTKSCYIPLLLSSIFKVLCSIHEEMYDIYESCTLEFLGKVIGKLSSLGHGDLISQRFFLEVVRRSENDSDWRRLSQDLVTKIPYHGSSLESFISHLLLTIPWYGYVEWILGDEGVKNSNFEYIMTTKLLLVRHFEKKIICQNIIGYFASSPNRQPSFWKIFTSLVKVWSDESTLKFQTFEQQKCIATSLVVCAGWMKELQDTSEGQAHISKILNGVMIRMGNSQENVISLGMIVGNLVVSSLDSTAPKLECQTISDKKLIEEMENLLVIPVNPGLDCLVVGDLDDFYDDLEKEPMKKKTEFVNCKKNMKTSLDSDDDDDLEPYDTSADATESRDKRPNYLSDCLKGLIEQKSGEWFEQCLKYTVHLVEANKNSVHEVAVELAKVTLHLEDTFSTPDFQRLRHEILVSLAVNSPVLIADYLTKQFYADDYNIRQRLDILQVIAESSQILSKPLASDEKVESIEPRMAKEAPAVSTEKLWQSIVNERVAAKTRHITQKRTSPPAMVENKFSIVAGCFFFPLLTKYDKKNKMLTLFGRDSYVLARLTYTLGVVMFSALNIPISAKMGIALLEFLKDVRNHTDKLVREAAIFAIAAVYSSVPSFQLLSAEMSPLVTQSRDWLQSIINEDPETNCQVKATYALGLILNVVKNELPDLFKMLTTAAGKE